jgi:hypothetical protein
MRDHKASEVGDVLAERERASGIEAAALVVEPVAHLVADDCADAAVIDRVIRVEVERRAVAG